MSNTRDFLYSEDSDETSQHSTSDNGRAEAIPNRTEHESSDDTNAKLYDVQSESTTTSAEILLLLGQCIGGPTKELLENLTDVHSLPENSSLHGSSSELSDIFTETGHPEINEGHLLDDILLRSIEAMNSVKTPRKRSSENVDICNTKAQKPSNSRKRTGTRNKVQNIKQKCRVADSEVASKEIYEADKSSTSQENQNQGNVNHYSTNVTLKKRRLRKRRSSRADSSKVQEIPLQCNHCFGKFKNVMAFNLHQVVHRKKNSMKAKPKEHVLSHYCTSDFSERFLTERSKSPQTTSSNCHLCARVLPLKVAVDMSKESQTSNQLSALHTDSLSDECSDESNRENIPVISKDEHDKIDSDDNQGSHMPEISRSAIEHCTRTVDFHSHTKTMHQHQCSRVLTFETQMQKKSVDTCSSDDTSQISNTKEECQQNRQWIEEGYSEETEKKYSNRSKCTDSCARVNSFDHHILSKASDEALKELSDSQVKSFCEDTVVEGSCVLNHYSPQRECFFNRNIRKKSCISCQSGENNCLSDGKEKLKRCSDSSAVCARVQTYQTHLSIKYSKEAREYLKFSDLRVSDDTCKLGNNFTEIDRNAKGVSICDAERVTKCDAKCLTKCGSKCLTSCDEACTDNMIEFCDGKSAESCHTSDADTCTEDALDILPERFVDCHNLDKSGTSNQYFKRLGKQVSNDFSAFGSAVNYPDKQSLCHATQTLSSMGEDECLTYEAHIDSSSGFSFDKNEVVLPQHKLIRSFSKPNLDSIASQNGLIHSADSSSIMSCDIDNGMVSRSSEDDSSVLSATKSHKGLLYSSNSKHDIDNFKNSGEIDIIKSKCRDQDQSPMHLNSNISSHVALTCQSKSKPEMTSVPSQDMLFNDFIKSPKKRWRESYHSEAKKRGIHSNVCDLFPYDDESARNTARQMLVKSADQVSLPSKNAQEKDLTYKASVNMGNSNYNNFHRHTDHSNLQQYNLESEPENTRDSNLSMEPSSENNWSISGVQADQIDTQSDHCSRTRQYIAKHDGVCARVVGLPFWPRSSRTRPSVHKTVN